MLIPEWNAAVKKVWELLKLYRPKSKNWERFREHLDYCLENARRDAGIAEVPAEAARPRRKQRP